MKTNRFEHIIISFGAENVPSSWTALCACIAESEQYVKERASA